MIPDHLHHVLISHSVTSSWHWANQFLPCPTYSSRRMNVVVVCADSSGRKRYGEVGMDRVTTSGCIDGVTVSTPRPSAKGVQYFRFVSALSTQPSDISVSAKMVTPVTSCTHTCHWYSCPTLIDLKSGRGFAYWDHVQSMPQESSQRRLHDVLLLLFCFFLHLHSTCASESILKDCAIQVEGKKWTVVCACAPSSREVHIVEDAIFQGTQLLKCRSRWRNVCNASMVHSWTRPWMWIWEKTKDVFVACTCLTWPLPIGWDSVYSTPEQLVWMLLTDKLFI